MTNETIENEVTCGCTGCGCTEPAETIDDGGVETCEECADYIVDLEGDVICAKRTDGFTRCHVCEAPIEWGNIRNDRGPWAYNYRQGDCECGEGAWVDEERGTWGHYAYVYPHDFVTAR